MYASEVLQTSLEPVRGWTVFHVQQNTAAVLANVREHSFLGNRGFFKGGPALMCSQAVLASKTEQIMGSKAGKHCHSMTSRPSGLEAYV